MKIRVQIVLNSKGGYTALCPTLPGCTSKGNTREEAQKKLDAAIQGYLAAIGNFVPEKLVHDVLEVT